MSTSYTPHPSSWRDPSGFIFECNGRLYRQVSQSYRGDFDLATGSGLYDQLVESGMMIPFEIINENLTASPAWYKTLQPEKIPIISYPYEWSFDMMKDAALLTLRVNREALKCGMILKDATPYNIQWHKGKMIFIDHLSFEKYDPSKPWIAYRQYCEMFLAPLLLAHYTKNECNRLMLAYPEGIPLKLTSSLLPQRTKLSLHVYLHIHLNASVSTKKSSQRNRDVKFSQLKLDRLLTSLEVLTGQLKAPVQDSAWTGYYEEASQRNDYLEQKSTLVRKWMLDISPLNYAADLGANKGEYSRLLATRNVHTIAADADAYCVNSIYLQKNPLLQPMVVDLANPAPGIGVNNDERAPYIQRAKVDLVLALALIHHLSIGKNIPFTLVASFFRQLSPNLVIEFVPKDDEKVRLMLSVKKDIYHDYGEAQFEEAFRKYYRVEKKASIPGTGRILYLMKANEA